MGGGFPQAVIAAGGAGPPGGGGGGGAAAVAAAHAGLLAVPPVGGGGENKTNEFMLYTESDDSDDDCAELGELNQGRRAALNCDRISGTNRVNMVEMCSIFGPLKHVVRSSSFIQFERSK